MRTVNVLACLASLTIASGPGGANHGGPCPSGLDPDSDGDGVGDALDLFPCDPDADHDLMPDGYELKLDLNPYVAADAVLDLDGDGLRAWEEYCWPMTPGVCADRTRLTHASRGDAPDGVYWGGSDPWDPLSPNAAPAGYLIGLDEYGTARGHLAPGASADLRFRDVNGDCSYLGLFGDPGLRTAGTVRLALAAPDGLAAQVVLHHATLRVDVVVTDPRTGATLASDVLPGRVKHVPVLYDGCAGFDVRLVARAVPRWGAYFDLGANCVVVALHCHALRTVVPPADARV